MSDWAQGVISDVLYEVDDRNTDRSIELVLSVTEGRGIVPQTDVFRKRIATDDTSKYKILRPFDIAWNPYLLWTGAIGQWLGSKPGVTSPVYPIFRVKDGHDARYWGLLLTSGILTPYFDSTAIGSIQRRRRTTSPVFNSASVAIPSLVEQRCIVDVMKAVDAQVEVLAEELRAALALRRSLIHQYEDATEVAIGDVASVSQGKALPKIVQGQRSGDVSWFKIADMTGTGNEEGYVVAETRLSADEIASLGGVILPAGAVAFPRVGAAVLTEKKRLLDVPGAVDENHLVLTPHDGVSSEYLLAVIEAIRLGDLVRTGAVPSLNMGLIRSAKVMWSSGGNATAGPALGSLRALTRELRGELVALRSFRSTLLTALLNQEIEIPESYDRVMDPAMVGVD